MYAISAHITHTTDGWEGSRGTPTFYLDERVQGIMSEEHAVTIAKDVINPLGTLTDEQMHIMAVRVNTDDAGKLAAIHSEWDGNTLLMGEMRRRAAALVPELADVQPDDIPRCIDLIARIYARLGL